VWGVCEELEDCIAKNPLRNLFSSHDARVFALKLICDAASKHSGLEFRVKCKPAFVRLDAEL
jgi:hypothetical protein